MVLLGHSPSGVDHGRVSRPGSTELAVMLSDSGICLPGWKWKTAARGVEDPPRRGGEPRRPR